MISGIHSFNMTADMFFNVTKVAVTREHCVSTYWKNVKDVIKFICYKIMPHVYDVLFFILPETVVGNYTKISW